MVLPKPYGGGRHRKFASLWLPKPLSAGMAKKNCLMLQTQPRAMGVDSVALDRAGKQVDHSYERQKAKIP
jgi:hypothetical protein